MNLFSQIGYVWENKRGGRERRMHLSSVCSKWIFDTACGLLLIAQITFCSAFTNSAYPSRITTVSIHFITRVDIHFQVSRQLVYCVLWDVSSIRLNLSNDNFDRFEDLFEFSSSPLRRKKKLEIRNYRGFKIGNEFKRR